MKRIIAIREGDTRFLYISNYLCSMPIGRYKFVITNGWYGRKGISIGNKAVPSVEVGGMRIRVGYGIDTGYFGIKFQIDPPYPKTTDPKKKL